MAAPAAPAAPANADVAAFAAASAAAGLWHDVSKANNAPRLALPPLAPFPWEGHPPRGAPPTAFCHDRPLFTNPPGPVHPCAGQFNNDHHLFIPDLPMQTRTAVNRRTCPEGAPYHAQGPYTYEVCDYCLYSARQQPWNVRIKQDVVHQPMAPLPPEIPRPPLRDPNSWTFFLTRLCRSCEIMELRVLHYRLISGTAAPLATAGQMIGWTATWPHVTCTCLFAFAKQCDGMTDLCARHRRREMVRFHNRRLVTKQQNDIWLRETGRDQNRLVWLRATRRGRARIHDRANRGAFCGCRCGQDIKRTPNRNPEVLLCLGCEGIVHTDNRRTWTQGNANAGLALYANGIPATETRARKREFDQRCNGIEPFNLRRPRV